MVPTGAHLEQEVLEPMALGGDQDRPRDIADEGGRPAAVGKRQEVLDVYESPHVVEIAFVHDDPAATRPMRLGRRHLDRDVGGHRDDVAARRHRIGSGQAGQFQRTSQQGVLLCGERTVASRLVEQQLEFGR